MKRTLLALLLAEALGGIAFAVEPSAPPPPPPPAAPRAPLPPLPPLPPIDRTTGAGSTATLAVTKPVTVRVDVISADLEVVAGGAKQVKAQLIDSAGGITLHQQGDRVDVTLSSAHGGWPHIPAGIDGRVRLELPPGSSVEITSASGDVVVRDVGGGVRLRTASGEVRLTRPASVEAQAVSGDVVIENASGEVRLRTVSGDARVTQNGTACKLEFGSTSGDLDWKGGCGPGCRIEARTMSGDVKLAPSTPNFDLRYVTHSGDISDDLKMQVIDNNPTKHGSGSVHGRFGKGEGIVEIQTFSGDVYLSRR
jgi:hypothetical protein